jgi:hypothetical protein
MALCDKAPPKAFGSSHGPRLDLFGPSVEFLTSPKDANQNFRVLRGVIPPGLAVPLHSHPDVEDF